MLDRMRANRALLVVLTLLVLAVGLVGLGVVSFGGGDDDSTREQRTAQLRGFHYTAWFDDDQRTIERRLDDVRAAGGDVIRVTFGWPTFEPRPRQIDDRALDRFSFLVGAAAKRKIKVIWLLGGTPCEYAEIPGELLARCVRALRENPRRASRRPEFITWPPGDEGAWRNALRLVLEEVGDRLAGAEVWNEPNMASFFRTEGDRVEDYVQILRWTYDEIKQRAPGLPVLAGSLANADVSFLKAMYVAGLKGLSDGIAVHPYSYRPAQGAVATRPGAITFDRDRTRSFRSGLVEIRRTMAANGEGDNQIWITEFGSRACGAARILCAGSERQQADWATESFVVAARMPFVAAMAMHELIDSDDLRFGALTKDGKRRPVFDAISRAREHLAKGRSGAPPLMPGCRPAPFGECAGRRDRRRSVVQRIPRFGHAYGVKLACGSAQQGVIDDTGRRVETDAGLRFSAGCGQPWRPGGDPADDGQQLSPGDGPDEGARRATLAFVAPGSRLMRDADGGLPGQARVVAIEAVQALLRANTTDSEVVLQTNALAERRRGSDLVLGCRRGARSRGRSDWPRIPSSPCDTSATVHLTGRAGADRIAVPRDRDVREVVWAVACPGPCDPAGGPFAARIALKRATLTVQELDAPEVDVDVDGRTAKITLSDLMGIDRAEVRVGGRRLAVHDTKSCRPSAGEVLRTRVPCPRDSDRRVTLDVRVPASGTLRVTARDALGNVARATQQLPG